ncbi:glycosyltransferase [Leptospira noguchii]|uniref:glycosyltransferase n=1 Tax=Leptospira noguchii TaxID=28182 RepID=UPI00032853A6|nr:glycosyltransferase family 2 protein [Leptospira noguchii]EMS86010.1 glycosyltransferase, group 2 family protein [Leptospira noguchii str. Hook]UOG36636.1 glycosyltransferase family 2 protein [Leptospira noguchii]UOG59285.1 glycosyltransferase family 2 protein [Leptospira noguchii]
MKFGVTVSIVLYKPNVSIFKELLLSLLNSITYQISNVSKSILYKIEVLDNTPQYGEEVKNIINDLEKKFSFKDQIKFQYFHFPENPGYGVANNRSILKSNMEFHLVLNPDIKMIPETLDLCVRYLEEHPDCDAVVPSVWDWEGDSDGKRNIQFLVKSYPTVFVLFLRSFAPGILKKVFRKYLDQYDLKEKDWNQTQENVSLISGCFIFARTKSLKQIGGFDERFFLYFEDFDLSMRLKRKDYFPKIQIYHKGGNSSKKGFLHVKLFIISAIRFFIKFGWKLI